MARHTNREHEHSPAYTCGNNGRGVAMRWSWSSRALLAVAVLGSLFCVSGKNRRTELVNRAAFELSCQPEAVSTVIISKAPSCMVEDWACATTVGVKGCGKQTTYVSDMRSGTWIRNGEISAEGSSGPDSTGGAAQSVSDAGQ